MSQLSKQISVVFGRPRGFTRSVLEALLKRGSSVVLVCSEADGQLGRAEVARLSDLYSAQRIQMATIQGQCARGRDIDQMMAEARDKLGNISFIVNSHNCLYKEFPDIYPSGEKHAQD